MAYISFYESDFQIYLDEASNRVHKLIVIIGASGSGKTEELIKFAAGYNVKLLNVGRELSETLLAVPEKLRASKAEDVLLGILSNSSSSVFALDNTEILFESPIALDPLKLFKQISKNKTIVVTWNGTIDEDGKLTYGTKGHPAYYSRKLGAEDDFQIIKTTGIA